MSNRKEHMNYNSSRLRICTFCGGSGQYIEFSQQSPDVEYSKCPICLGEGIILQTCIMQTRPITLIDKIQFRKVNYC